MQSDNIQHSKVLYSSCSEYVQVCHRSTGKHCLLCMTDACQTCGRYDENSSGTTSIYRQKTAELHWRYLGRWNSSAPLCPFHPRAVCLKTFEKPLLLWTCKSAEPLFTVDEGFLEHSRNTPWTYAKSVIDLPSSMPRLLQEAAGWRFWLSYSVL